MARLLADENFPEPVVLRLRELGHDVVTLSEIQRAGKSLSDVEVLEIASREGRAVLTLNRMHFILLHSKSSRHHGIVACTFDRDFTSQAQRIHEAVIVTPVEGVLLRVNRPG